MSLFSHLELVEDKRSSINQHHDLTDVLFLIISAVLSGCEGWKDIEVFGHSKLPWLRQFRAFKHGIPTRHSIARILKTVETDSLVLALFSWVNEQRSQSGRPIIAFDGKTLRGASKKREDNLHLVSAFDCESGLTLYQRTVENKSNEIPAVRALLDVLDISDSIVTLDALHCQKATLTALISRGADYLVQVKANQKTLYKAVTSCFETAFEQEENLPEDVQVSNGHGRQETRITYALKADKLPEEIKEKWPGITSLVAVERHNKSESVTKIDTHFYVTSVEPDAQMLQKAIRHHWHIENQQHWVLDVVFKEDACQISEPISAENMALFRRVVRNLVKQHTGRKDSIRGKCVRASFDDEFRAELIFG